jgi:starvation-inducible outer membrane lipoprotein
MKKTLLLALTLLIISCDSKPKVLVADESTNPEKVTNNQMAGTMQTNDESGQVHQVVANEILNTDRYTYLYVTEGNRKFWLATSKMDAKKGRSYMYSGGLLKVNFESLEFKRNFDTIYLVSQVIDASMHTANNPLPQDIDAEQITNKTPLPEIKGAVKIADLLKNKAKYKDKIITVTGAVTKVNNGIMGRNWVHIRDKSGKDLTITTNSVVNVSDAVAFKGKITLEKDFGAGYKYDVIMEEAERQ